MIRAYIDDFLKQERIALVGVSRQPQHFSRHMLSEFLRRGYDAVPVTPHTDELEGRRCYPRVAEISPPPTAALLLVRPQLADSLVKECAAAGITRVWIFGTSGKNVSPALIDYCAQNRITLVPGYCPHMFFPETAFFHRVHAFFLKLTGRYPTEARP